MTDGEPSKTSNRSTMRSMVVYDRQAANVGEARAWIEGFLVERAVVGAVCDDAQLVVSELITNALMHGAGELVLRASISDATVQIAVTDAGDDLPEVLAIDPSRIGGLGLIVVNRVAADWGVSPFPGGKTVWATLALPS